MGSANQVASFALLDPAMTVSPPLLAGAGEPLWQATSAIHRSGIPLMARVLPNDGTLKAWQHYPPRDVVNGARQARWFYHCHNPDDRGSQEHGHFHLFLGRRAFSRGVRPLVAPPGGRKPRPSIVHIAALSIDFNGLPTGWFVTNRWVTDEWLYPAAAITGELPQLGFSGDDGDPLVNDWLGAILRASHGIIADLLAERDLILALRDPAGEDRAIEVVAQAPIDLDVLLSA